MIIGSGLLANSLIEIDSDDIVFFCSGVSNSAETNSHNFLREYELLKSQNRDKKLIYFSTISIDNPAKKDSPYIIHKVNMENYVEANFTRHIILRLPNMVGQGGNKNNLFPYFFHSILTNSPVELFKNAVRHLMSVKDLPIILNQMILMEFNGKINVCYSNAPLVSEIYLYMCKLLQKNPNYSLQENEEAIFQIDNSRFEELIQKGGLKINSVWQNIITEFTNSLLNPGNNS